MAVRQLVLARILRHEDTAQTMFESGVFRTDLLEALALTKQVERFNRVWRLSQPVVERDRWIWGKLGTPAATVGRSYHLRVSAPPR